MRKLWIFLTLAALFTAAWLPKPAYATEFGVNYMPYVSGANTMEFLCDRNWTTATKNMVKADLNMMNSMGLTCQRLMFFANGWVLPSRWGSQNYQAPYFSSDFSQIIANLPEFLGMCSERNIKLDVTFCQPWLCGTDPGTGLYWWQYAYGDTPSGWDNFMDDTAFFVTSVVDTIENSGYASTVQWYDIANEIYTTPFYDKYIPYIRAYYDNGWIPASKIGFSVLRVPPSGTTDYDTLKTSTWLGTTRAANTKLTDSHCYPELDSNDWNVGFKYNKAQTLYPNSTTIVGEYAYSYTVSGEATQATNEIQIMDNIINAGIPYAMHWLFVDLYYPDPYTWKTGWFRDFDITKPNDVVGSVGNKLSKFTNGDMEQATGNLPTGWSYGSNYGYPITGDRCGPNTGDACTNQYYYRLNSHSVGDNIYTLSPYTAVPACSKIYVNAYIRGSVSNIRIGIHQYDANGNWLGFSSGPSFTPGTWKYYSYQHAVNGWVCTANANTRYVYVGVIADVTSDPGYLDTDAVTLSVR